jgi:transcriptional regulator with XRE-family HTH domain
MATEILGVALADRIKELRLAAGISQEQLAYRAGVTISVVRSLEQGTVENPQWFTIRGIARVLGVSLDDLAAAAEEPPGVKSPQVGRPRKSKKGGK